MVLRFYRGGPVAVPSSWWWSTRKPNRRVGCLVAQAVGAKIPSSTYEAADAEWSAETYFSVDKGRKVGTNDTAILPLEE